MRRTAEDGSHVIALGLFIAVIAVAGFAGYRVWQMQQAGPADSSSVTAKVPAAITNTASLDEASTVLDQSSTQLDSNLDDSGLDSSLNSML